MRVSIVISDCVSGGVLLSNLSTVYAVGSRNTYFEFRRLQLIAAMIGMSSTDAYIAERTSTNGCYWLSEQASDPLIELALSRVSLCRQLPAHGKLNIRSHIC